LNYVKIIDFVVKCLDTFQIFGEERAEKLNPPQGKRTKSIPVEDLQKETGKLQREGEGY
jgi:hypothetical protein